jgi:hypothetical protein
MDQSVCRLKMDAMLVVVLPHCLLFMTASDAPVRMHALHSNCNLGQNSEPDQRQYAPQATFGRAYVLLSPLQGDAPGSSASSRPCSPALSAVWTACRRLQPWPGQAGAALTQDWFTSRAMPGRTSRTPRHPWLGHLSARIAWRCIVQLQDAVSPSIITVRPLIYNSTQGRPAARPEGRRWRAR